MSSAIQELKDKIYLQRGVQSFWEQRTRAFSNRYKVVVVTLSGLLTFLALADLPGLLPSISLLAHVDTPLVLGLLSLLIFLLSIFVDIFSVSHRHTEHRRAVDRYTMLLRDLYGMANSGDTQPTTESVSEIERRYRDISTSVVTLTDAQFEQGERAYLRRRLRRRVIKQYPMAGPVKRWWLMRRQANGLQ